MLLEKRKKEDNSNFMQKMVFIGIYIAYAFL